jgi:hypothetical protein
VLPLLVCSGRVCGTSSVCSTWLVAERQSRRCWAYAHLRTRIIMRRCLLRCSKCSSAQQPCLTPALTGTCTLPRTHQQPHALTSSHTHSPAATRTHQQPHALSCSRTQRTPPPARHLPATAHRRVQARPRGRGAWRGPRSRPRSALHLQQLPAQGAAAAQQQPHTRARCRPRLGGGDGDVCRSRGL